MIKLIASDLDGTLLPPEGKFRPRVREAVRRVIDAGIIVSLASGRTFESTLMFARDLGANGPLICYQGALIKDPRTGEVLHEERIPAAVMRDVVLHARDRRLHVNLYVDDETYMERLEAEGRLYQTISRRAQHAIPDLLAVLDRDPTKCIWVSPTEEHSNELMALLREEFGGRMEVVRSHAVLIEGAPLGSNKGRALALLAARLGIQQEETAALGDNDNDIEMLSWAGLGLAMANASPAVLAVARHVIPPVWDDGAAYGIEHCILSGGAC